MKQSLAIFGNPVAGRGKSIQIATALTRRLSGLYDVHFFEMPAERINLEELRPLNLKAAISVGGDGTLQGVAELLIKCFPRVPPIMIIPLGTANLMAKHLRIPWHDEGDLEMIATALQSMHIAELDAGRCNGRLFLAMAGVGFDAHVVHELHRTRNGPIAKSSYIRPTISALRDYEYPPIRVEVDGQEVFPSQPGMVVVGNVREYGTGVPWVNQASSHDSLLDVFAAPCRNTHQSFKLVLQAVTGEHVDREGAVYARGRRIRIESDSPVAIQLDGEPAGHTPAVIELLEFRMPFIVPAS